jgi:glycosyltransferase involved in cell wall biosynthesis
MAARGEAGAALGVVIPAYRAAGTVGAVVADVAEAAPDARIYVIDDGSADATADAAARAGADVVALPAHQGKGAALAAGIARAVRDGAAVIATLDADGQHAAGELPRLVAPVVAGTADLALGARARTAAMPIGRRFNNWLSAALVSRVAGYPVADAQTGFRAFARRVAVRVQPTQRHYDYELAFLLGALAAGFRVDSVPVATIYDGAPSHFRAVTDTWRLARVFARHGGRILRGGR